MTKTLKSIGCKFCHISNVVAADKKSFVCADCGLTNFLTEKLKLSKSQIAAVTAIADKKLEVSCNGDIYAAFSSNLTGLTAVRIDTIEALEDKGYIYRNINGLYPKLSLTDSGKALCRELGLIKDEPVVTGEDFSHDGA